MNGGMGGWKEGMIGGKYRGTKERGMDKVMGGWKEGKIGGKDDGIKERGLNGGEGWMEGRNDWMEI